MQKVLFEGIPANSLRAKRRARYRKHYLKNRTELLEKDRKRRMENKEKLSEYRKKYRRRNLAKMLEMERAHRARTKQGIRLAYVKYTYGLNYSKFKAMYDAQDGRCASCGSPFKSLTDGGLEVDHDHTTGGGSRVALLRLQQGAGDDERES